MDMTGINFKVWILASLFIYISGTTPGCEFTSTRITCKGPNVTGIPEILPINTTDVRIQHADIKTLNTSALSQLQQLYLLYVEYSGVSDLVDNAFTELKLLQMISLKGNRLTALEKGTFSNLTSLKQLRLSENQLVSIDGAFDDLVSLEILSLNDNQISDISADIFKDLSNLHHLELNNNKIKVIQPGAFENMKTLMLLGLGSNPLTSLKSIFPDDMMLQYLNLTACELTAIPSDLPSPLKYLKLTKNKITAIHKSDTERYIHLSALILEENGLLYVEPGAFSQMKALKDIFLFVNMLQAIPGPFPAGIKNIHLDNNEITQFPPGMFQNGTSLAILSLRINNITSFRANSFQNIESIKEIHLERNPFTVLHDDTFKLANGLQFLNLNHLKLTAAYPDCFLNLNSLTKLEMSFVQISKDQVHGNIFRNLPLLGELELQESPTLAENFLTNLIIEHKKMKSITKLNLEDNGLDSLSSDIQSYLPNLQKLSLRGNKFHCNANLLWLRTWHIIEPDKFHKFDQVRCYSPRYLQGRRIEDVKVWQFYDQTGSKDSQVITSPSTYKTLPTTYDLPDSTPNEYIYPYYDYEEYDNRDLYPYDYMEHSTVNTEDISNHSILPTLSLTASTSVPTQDHVPIQNYDTADGENKDIQVPNQTPKQKKHENSSSLKTAGIAFGMAFGVIVVMLLAAFVVYKVWKRKHQATLQNRHHQNGGQDYVFISTQTDRQDKPEPKVHRKMSRAERGSTTSRASEDITNHTDTDMKVYMLDVDA